MANQKAQEHVSKQVADAFDQMDKNDDGKVSMCEFRQYCKGVPGMEKIAEVFCEVDTSDDCQISLDELNDLCTNKIPKDKIEECHVTDVFRTADTSGDGKLTKEEFRKLLTDIGYSESTIQGTLDSVCGDDGYVTLQEFLREWAHDS